MCHHYQQIGHIEEELSYLFGRVKEEQSYEEPRESSQQYLGPQTLFMSAEMKHTHKHPLTSKSTILCSDNESRYFATLQLSQNQSAQSILTRDRLTTCCGVDTGVDGSEHINGTELESWLHVICSTDVFQAVRYLFVGRSFRWRTPEYYCEWILLVICEWLGTSNRPSDVVRVSARCAVSVLHYVGTGTKDRMNSSSNVVLMMMLSRTCQGSTHTLFIVVYRLGGDRCTGPLTSILTYNSTCGTSCAKRVTSVTDGGVAMCGAVSVRWYEDVGVSTVCVIFDNHLTRVVEEERGGEDEVRYGLEIRDR
ncbi:hypothetical protein Tco_0616035 [Tanacetum coccineum]